MLNPITIIRDQIEHLWSKITLKRWENGLDLGMTLGEQKAWREAFKAVQIKAADIKGFQDSASNKITKAGSDGMQIGYEMALHAIREELDARNIILLTDFGVFDDKEKDVA